MTTDVRYARLIPMVQAVLSTLDEGIEAEQAIATELARLAQAMADAQSVAAPFLLSASHQHTVKALELRGKRAALLTGYGLGMH